MAMRWLRRIAGVYLQAMGYDAGPLPLAERAAVQPVTRPSCQERTDFAWPDDSSLVTGPQTWQARPLHRPPPRPDLPMPPRPAYPFCYCGRTWPDTPRGRWASEQHVDAGKPECVEAARQFRLARERQKRQAVMADPVLAPQQRAYDQEIQQRRRERARH